MLDGKTYHYECKNNQVETTEEPVMAYLKKTGYVVLKTEEA